MECSALVCKRMSHEALEGTKDCLKEHIWKTGQCTRVTAQWVPTAKFPWLTVTFFFLQPLPLV